MKIVTTTTYERAVRKLLSIAERDAMEAAIAADPLAAPVIPKSGGIRKLRWAGSGRGKRGGVRTIYFFLGKTATVYLLTAYAKARRDDVSRADLQAWRRLIDTIETEGGQ